MARKEKKYHFIYKTTNILNDKFYIGMHSTNNLEDGYVGSGTRLWYSINKYGLDNFKIEILEFLPNRKSLKQREKEIINSDFLLNEKCMNIKIGGGGGFTLEQCKNGRKITDKKLLEKYGNDFKSIIIKNYHNSLTNEQQIIHKNKIKEGLLKINYNHKTFLNKKHKEESKLKIGKSNSIKQKGEKNSQYGTCWINKEKENKKIKKEELNTWLKKGWIKGRKIL